MTREEAGRLGGLALSSKVSKSYFRFIGRRGGRRTRYNFWMSIAIEEEDLELKEYYLERASFWLDEVGSMVMLQLWLPEYDEPKRRISRFIGEQALRKWQKAQKFW